MEAWDWGRGQHPFCGVFSPDGTTLASGSKQNGTVKLWNVTTGENIAILSTSFVSIRGRGVLTRWDDTRFRVRE